MLSILVSSFVVPVWAALLDFRGTPARTIDVSGLSIPVFAEAFPKPAGGASQERGLVLSGAGIRKKAILFLDINAYAAAAYFEPGTHFAVDRDPMEAVTKSSMKAIQLTFVRGVSKGQVLDSFTKSLKANGADMESSLVKNAVRDLSYDMPLGSQMTLLASRQENGSETLWFETPQGITHSDGPGVSDTFFKIWFGAASDGGMGELKKMLTALPNLP